MNHEPIITSLDGVYSKDAEGIALALLDLGALELQKPGEPFTWSSGWKSPIYTNNRLIMGSVEVRTLLNTSFMDYCTDHNLLQSADAIAGVLTAGAIYGYGLALSTNLPFVCIRPKPKEHGLKGVQVEGMKAADIVGKKFIVIEDLNSTGKSSAVAAQVIRDAGGIVVAMVSIFTYGFDDVRKTFNAELGDKNILTEPCIFGSLTSFQVLINAATAKGLIDDESKKMLATFIESPSTYTGV